MNILSSKYISLLLITSIFHAEAIRIPKREQSEKAVGTRSCPTPVAKFCSVNADCLNVGTIIATGVINITNTTPSTDCTNGALVVAGGLGVGGDLNVCGSATIDENLTVFEQVSNRIGATYTIGVDLPTIQSGIDLASSGLKPDSASNASPLPLGAKNVILNIPAGVYHESLFIDTDFSDATINDAGTDTPNFRSRGLSLVGDTRPIAAMTYMNGGLLQTDVSFTVNSGLNSLGALNSVVTLTNVGNTLTVAIVPGPQPNFVASGVVAGDIIIVTDNNGTVQQRNVVSVAGNTVTYDSTPVTITGVGAALTFCPNVQIINTIPDAICYIASGAVEMTGIWFAGDPAFAATAIYGVFIEGTGALYPNQILIDGRNLPNNANGALHPFNGGQVNCYGKDVNFASHLSVIAGRIVADHHSSFVYGYYYVMASNTHPNQAGMLNRADSLFLVDSLQVNGANRIRGYQNPFHGFGDFTAVFSAFNCTDGCFVGNGAQVRSGGVVIINGCINGLDISNGSYANSAASPTFGLTPTISNCTTAIKVDLNGLFTTAGPLILNTNTNGIQLINGSRFASSNNITFTGVTNPYAIDSGSVYNTLENVAGTDPSPNNIYTYSTAGSRVMNSAYLKQLLDSVGVVNVQLNPGLTAAGTPEYIGKIYTLTAISGGSHILTLVGGATFLDGTTFKTFSGVGSTLTIQIDSATSVAILSNIGVV